jgi:predicted RNase H-like HicB family nuclease
MMLTIRISRYLSSGFRARCPALPGCSAFGRSRAEARGRIEDAVRGYLARLETTLPRELSRLARLGSS